MTAITLSAFAKLPGPGQADSFILINEKRRMNPVHRKRKGVIRVKVCEGRWLPESEGATKTRATYSVYTDTGGAIPALIANRASQSAIGRLFAAARKQVKDPKYSLNEKHAASITAP